MDTERNLLVMTFPESARTFEALSKIKGQPGVASAAVVERTCDGQVRITDGYAPAMGSGPAVGGLVGAVVGILGGPLGVLLGWSTGLLVGTLHDTDEAADTEDGFTLLSKRIPAGGNALFVEMTETSHAIADDIALSLGGRLTRVPAATVDAEVATAREALHQAAKAAGKVRREARKAEFKEKVGSVLHHARVG